MPLSQALLTFSYIRLLGQRAKYISRAITRDKNSHVIDNLSTNSSLFKKTKLYTSKAKTKDSVVDYETKNEDYQKA